MRTLLVGAIISLVLGLFGPAALQAAGDIGPDGNGSAFQMAGDIGPDGNG